MLQKISLDNKIFVRSLILKTACILWWACYTRSYTALRKAVSKPPRVMKVHVPVQVRCPRGGNFLLAHGSIEEHWFVRDRPWKVNSWLLTLSWEEQSKEFCEQKIVCDVSCFSSKTFICISPNITFIHLLTHNTSSQCGLNYAITSQVCILNPNFSILALLKHMHASVTVSRYLSHPKFILNILSEPLWIDAQLT